jgi:uncharacterized protein (TIGR02246 family)
MRRFGARFAPYMGALGLVAAAACTPNGRASLTPADRLAIDTLRQTYVSAWLRDDTTGVLATFTLDGMLLPPGNTPVEGQTAIRAYWWPQDGSHTAITAFTLTMDELDGAGPIAYARGLSTLSWTYTKDSVTQTQSGKNLGLTIFRRDASGRWRITRQMWGPSLKP